mgnify:CR=1 FL=1|jgi:hypothetical protein
MEILDQEMRRAAKRERGFLGFSEESFFNFGRFWASGLIKLVYFLGFLVLNGLLAMAIVIEAFSLPLGYAGYEYVSRLQLPPIISVVGYLAFGLCANISWRIICELFIIPFRIYEVLRSIDGKLGDMHLRDIIK